MEDDHVFCMNCEVENAGLFREKRIKETHEKRIEVSNMLIVLPTLFSVFKEGFNYNWVL